MLLLSDWFDFFARQAYLAFNSDWILFKLYATPTGYFQNNHRNCYMAVSQTFSTNRHVGSSDQTSVQEKKTGELSGTSETTASSSGSNYSYSQTFSQKAFNVLGTVSQFFSNRIRRAPQLPPSINWDLRPSFDLSMLETFLSINEKDALTKIAKNQCYRLQFKKFQQEVLLPQNSYPTSPQAVDWYTEPLNCNVLYWAWKNKLLSNAEFVEQYGWLQAVLFFLPQKLSLPLTGYDALASKLQLVSAEKLNSFALANPKLKVQIEYLKDQCLFLHNELLLEVTLTDSFFDLFKKYSSKPGLAHRGDMSNRTIDPMNMAFWMHLLQYNFEIIIFCDSTQTLYIPSHNILKECCAWHTDTLYPPKTHSPLELLPVFGTCSWDQVKKMRYKHQQPFAFWNINVSENAYHPDKYWFFTGSGWHDTNHARSAFRFSNTYRISLLMLDDITIEPLIKFWQYYVQGTKQNFTFSDDEINLFEMFIHGFNEQKQLLKVKHRFCSIISLPELKPTKWNRMDAKYVNQFEDRILRHQGQRELIDQEHEYYDLLAKRAFRNCFTLKEPQVIEQNLRILLLVKALQQSKADLNQAFLEDLDKRCQFGLFDSQATLEAINFHPRDRCCCFDESEIPFGYLKWVTQFWKIKVPTRLKLKDQP